VVGTADSVTTILGERPNNGVWDLIDAEGGSFNGFGIIWYKQGVNEVMVPLFGVWVKQVLHLSIWRYGLIMG
jgi:hypothetical protein